MLQRTLYNPNVLRKEQDAPSGIALDATRPGKNSRRTQDVTSQLTMVYKVAFFPISIQLLADSRVCL